MDIEGGQASSKVAAATAASTGTSALWAGRTVAAGAGGAAGGGGMPKGYAGQRRPPTAVSGGRHPDARQHLVVQQTVGRQRVAAPAALLAVETGEPATRLLHDRDEGGHVVDGQLRLGSDVCGPLGN